LTAPGAGRARRPIVPHSGGNILACALSKPNGMPAIGRREFKSVAAARDVVIANPGSLAATPTEEKPTRARSGPTWRRGHPSQSI